MAQHDYVIDNSTGANVRADINNALLAISSNNSGSSAPSTTYALQTFANTTDSMLQLRNAANNAFVNLRKFDGSCPLPDGTNSAPSLFFDDDTNTGLYSSAADTLNFATGGTERLELGTTTVFNEDGADVDFRIEGDSEANLFYVDAGNDKIGIGTSSPSSSLEISVGDSGTTSSAGFDEFSIEGGNENIGMCFLSPAANNCKQRISFGDSNNNNSGEIQYDHNTDDLTLKAADNIILTGDAVLIGTSTPRGLGHLEIEGTTFEDSGLTLVRNVNSTGATSINICKTRGSVGGVTSVANGDVLGGINFRGADGANLRDACDIRGEVDGTPSQGSDMPGRLTFRTSADGSSSPQERFRLNSNGDIHIARTDTLALGANNVTGINLLAEGRILASSQNSQSEFGRQGSNGEVVRFACQGTGNVGSIDVTTSSTSYTSGSDYRLKENITAISDGIIRLKTLKPSRFNFKVDKDKTVDGFLAHEVTAVPEAISGTKDEVATEDNELAGVKKGDPIYQKIDLSKLVPLLTAALQEAITKIETLETKVAALETA